MTQQDEPNPDPSIPVSTDVVVVGGGTIGAMVTLHLAQAGLKVVCLEAHTKNFGSSQRSAAAARQQFGMEANIKLQLYSIDFFRRFRETLGGTQAPMRHNGYNFMYDGWVQENGGRVYDPDRVMMALEKRVAFQKSCGLQDVELLTPDQVKKRFPYIETEKIACATFCPSDGFCYPDVITNDAFDKAISLGAQLLQNTAVVDFEIDGTTRNIVAVKTTKGKIICKEVVNAAGIWAPAIASKVGTFLPIRAVRRYLYFWGPNKGTQSYEEFAASNNLPLPMEDMPFTIVPGGAYCRPDGGHFMTGWDHKPAEQTTYAAPDILDRDAAQRFQDEIENGFHRNDPDTYGDEMAMKISEVMPFLAEHCGSSSVTAGFYEVTADHSPIICRDPSSKNLIHCAGFSGHGIMQSPAAGLLVTEIIMDGRITFVDGYVYSLVGLLARLSGCEAHARPHETMVI